MLLLGSDLCAPTPNSYGEALVPNVMVFGDGALGRGLGLDEVVRVEPSR